MSGENQHKDKSEFPPGTFYVNRSSKERHEPLFVMRKRNLQKGWYRVNHVPFIRGVVFLYLKMAVLKLNKLKQFQENGHIIQLIIGDFTGKVGDPTGKSAAPKQLTAAEVKHKPKHILSSSAKCWIWKKWIFTTIPNGWQI